MASRKVSQMFAFSFRQLCQILIIFFDELFWKLATHLSISIFLRFMQFLLALIGF